MIGLIELLRAVAIKIVSLLKSDFVLIRGRYVYLCMFNEHDSGHPYRGVANVFNFKHINIVKSLAEYKGWKLYLDEDYGIYIRPDQYKDLWSRWYVNHNTLA